MAWGAYDYSSLHGTKTLFDFLVRNGYRYRYVTRDDTARLTDAVLADTRILFVDLIAEAEDCADFASEEIETIRRWVRRGGSLLVVVDHTNVYDHARRTNPLLEPFGVQAPFATAMDKVPENAMQGGVWVKVRSFADHPVTRGAEWVVLMTGTTLDTKHGVAFLSAHGFADAWWPQRPHPSLMGNFRYDEGEPRGALPVVAAADYGKGRFVVLGDENILGNSRLFVANNFELVTNSFAWLARDEDAAVPLRERLTTTLRVGFDLTAGDWNVVGNGCNCYLQFFVDFNRNPGVVARAVPSLRGRWDVLVLVDPILQLTPQDLAYLRRHVHGGGTLLLLTDVARARPGTPALLRELLPDLVLSGRREFAVKEIPAGTDLLEPIRAQLPFPVESAYLDVDGLRLAAHDYPPDKRCGLDVDSARPYLLRLSVASGEPFLQAQVGKHRVDLARLYTIGRGRLIVFFQDSFFRSESIGVERNAEPSAQAQDSHRVIRALVQWLLKVHAPDVGVHD
jgi:hypothetical protein